MLSERSIILVMRYIGFLVQNHLLKFLILFSKVISVIVLILLCFLI